MKKERGERKFRIVSKQKKIHIKTTIRCHFILSRLARITSDNGKCCLGGGGMRTVIYCWHLNFENYLGVSTTVEETCDLTVPLLGVVPNRNKYVD